jgi:hypothetical protein
MGSVKETLASMGATDGNAPTAVIGPVPIKPRLSIHCSRSKLDDLRPGLPLGHPRLAQAGEKARACRGGAAPARRELRPRDRRRATGTFAFRRCELPSRQGAIGRWGVGQASKSAGEPGPERQNPPPHGFIRDRQAALG